MPRNVASCLGRWFVLPQQLLPPLLPLHKTLFHVRGHLTSSGHLIKPIRLSLITIEPLSNVVAENHTLRRLKKCLKLAVARHAAVNVHMRIHYSVSCPFLNASFFSNFFPKPEIENQLRVSSALDWQVSQVTVQAHWWVDRTHLVNRVRHHRAHVRPVRPGPKVQPCNCQTRLSCWSKCSNKVQSAYLQRHLLSFRSYERNSAIPSKLR